MITFKRRPANLIGPCAGPRVRGLSRSSGPQRLAKSTRACEGKWFCPRAGFSFERFEKNSRHRYKPGPGFAPKKTDPVNPDHRKKGKRHESTHQFEGRQNSLAQARFKKQMISPTESTRGRNALSKIRVNLRPSAANK